MVESIQPDSIRLFNSIPHLHGYNEGREVLLAFKDDVGIALKFICQQTYDSNALQLTKAVKILRGDMSEIQQKFKGNFSGDCQTDLVSSSVITLINMILEGPNIIIKGDEENTVPCSIAAQTIGQLLVFNMVKHSRSESGVIRHNKDKENPLTLYYLIDFFRYLVIWEIVSVHCMKRKLLYVLPNKNYNW